MTDHIWAKHLVDGLRGNGIRASSGADGARGHAHPGRARHPLDPADVDRAELEQQADGLVKLCYVSAQPVAIVLPSELTGGKGG